MFSGLLQGSTLVNSTEMRLAGKFAGRKSPFSLPQLATRVKDDLESLAIFKLMGARESGLISGLGKPATAAGVCRGSAAHRSRGLLRDHLDRFSAVLVLHWAGRIDGLRPLELAGAHLANPLFRSSTPCLMCI